MELYQIAEALSTVLEINQTKESSFSLYATGNIDVMVYPWGMENEHYFCFFASDKEFTMHEYIDDEDDDPVSEKIFNSFEEWIEGIKEKAYEQTNLQTSRRRCRLSRTSTAQAR